MSQLLEIEDKFMSLFGRSPALLLRSPGRINLIGEHTDYNEGFVLPAAIDKSIYFAASPNNQPIIRVYAYDLNESYQTDLAYLSPEKEKKTWVNHHLGIFELFKQRGKAIGVDYVFGGNIPIGAGLSSSAAIACGVAFILNELTNKSLSRQQLARIAQKSEHYFVGVKCGIMDQFACLLGTANQAIRLDCKSLDFEYCNVPLGEYTWVLCDSKVSHSLAESEYNLRRSECLEGVQHIAKHNPHVKSLRDVTLSLLENYRASMHKTVFQRCAYVIEENERVHQAYQLLQENRLHDFGQLLYQTHEGLQQQYQVSCPELDWLVDFTRADEQVLGARMMGGGFGGCTLNLVHKKYVHTFADKISKGYHQFTGQTPDIHNVSMEDGISVYGQYKRHTPI